MKALKFVGSSLDDLRKFPEEARRAAGLNFAQFRMGLSRVIGNQFKLLGRARKKSAFMFWVNGE